MWGPATRLPPRLTLSVLAGAGRFCILRCGGATRKDWPARNRRGFSDSHLQLLPLANFGESRSRAHKYTSDHKRYVTDRKLAETLAQMLRRKLKKHRQLVMECNPGPGILTEALLETGVDVIALESDKTFIPHLKSLGKSLDGKLKVIHCDFFKVDHNHSEPPRSAITVSHRLFQNLEIEAVPWSSGVPFKVIGIFPLKNERKALWKLLYDLYSCTSIYKYGRVELNMFIGEKEYQKLMANPRNPDLYQVLSVLWQVACDIKVLHKEPWSSFDVYNRNGQLGNTKHKELLQRIQQNMYLIQMTPRRNLFTENLTPINYDVFFHMVKHCFGKPNAQLIHHLHALSPVDTKDILTRSRKSEKVKVTDVFPQEFKRLFEKIECSKDYAYRWLYDDIVDDLHG
ncbi:dimethyladenosine transferase 2, mitochondrial isoform X1 [Castor canadensis]|uniref:dimethyladenosine transferase 2, mitochondrial isoform X1 n=1 Tax=Castor canadensis TaxID=51338 RepID=UPI003D180475